MKTEELVELKKREFLKRFNVERSIGTAKKKALGAAFQRNKIYSGEYNLNIRSKVRDTIYVFLDGITLKYSVVRTEDEYEKDVIDLKLHLNNLIDSGIDNLKISHTQKILSVFLKHLWCLGKIPTPPQCPVDRNTLLLLYTKNTPSWTKIDKIEQYRFYINEIKKHITNSSDNSLSIAEWELIAFQYVIDAK